MNRSVMTAELEAARMPSRPSPLSPLYYFGAWTDTDCLCGCEHFHLTVASAVACVSGAQAGSYVIAVEKGAYRNLNTTEEAEFQELMYGHPERKQADILNWPKKNPEPVD